MSRSLPEIRPSRTTIAIAVAVVAAAAVAMLAVLPPASERHSGSGGSPARSQASDAMDAGAGGGFSAGPVVGATDEVAGAKSLSATAVAPESGASGSNEAALDAPAAAGTTLSPVSLDQRLVRMGSVELRTTRAAFDDAWSDVQHVATGNGGYVLGTSRSGAGRGARVATVSMRVPSARFQDALDDLRGLDAVKVRGLDVTSQDVTEEYVDTRSRLRHDRAVEARLLSLLAETDGVSEVLAVQARLDTVQEQIEVARGRLQYLDKMTTMSTIDVALRAPGTSTSTDEPTEGTLAGAWHDSVDRFTANVAAAIVWFGGALPALLLLAVLGIAGRVAWRRWGRREEPQAASEE